MCVVSDKVENGVYDDRAATDDSGCPSSGDTVQDIDINQTIIM